jgi:K+-sensing histidine kinase KdpD
VAEVLRNLLTNTGRYAVPAATFRRVVIDVGSEGSPIQYIEEGGRGLPPAIAADPWRLHPRDASLEASSGQGLFMAKKLMQIHGGDLEYNLRTPNEPDGPGFVLWLKSPNSAPPPEPAPSEGSL